MKKEVLAIGVLALFLLVLTPSVSARRGVGILWTEQSAVVEENSKYCLSYGIYNPWDEAVNATLSISDEFKSIISEQSSEAEFIAPETYHDKAIPVELCFTVPKIYPEDCLIAGMICEQKCIVDEKLYQGEVLVSDATIENSDKGFGSVTSVGVSAPLKIKVKCSPHSRDWSLAYVALIILAVLAIIIALYIRNRTPPLEREQARLKALQEKIERLKKRGR